MPKGEKKGVVDVSGFPADIEEKTGKRPSFSVQYFAGKSGIVKGLKNFIKDKEKISYIILGLIILTIIAVCFLLYAALKAPNIPKKALEMPERGLPIED